jgi:hypothetical protein
MDPMGNIIVNYWFHKPTNIIGLEKPTNIILWGKTAPPYIYT